VTSETADRGGRPAAQLPALAPDLRRIADEIQAVLRDALPSGEQDRRLARAGLELAGALRYLADAAAGTDQAAQDEALAEADTRLLSAARHTRAARALAATTGELAAAEEAERDRDLDTSQCIATAATVTVLWPATGQGPRPDEVRAVTSPRGLRWTSALHGELPADGRAYLDVAAALAAFAAACQRAATGGDPDP
jgi:hypothetical protein